MRGITVGVSMLVCLPWLGCGGGKQRQNPPPQQQTEQRQAADSEQQADPDRPLAGIGETFHGLRRDAEEALGVELVERVETRLEPWTQGGGAIAVVVHGIDHVEGNLDALANWLGQRGHRVYKYKYDDNADLDLSARLLGETLAAELAKFPSQTITIVAHSMGGLVSRRALTEGHPSGLAARPESIELVTIASPFGGFDYANHSRRDMGFGADSWQDVGSTSKFITQPGWLGARVRHWKIETDEVGKKRILNGKRASDEAVTIEQQRQQDVDAQLSRRLMVDLGHVMAITTDDRQVPAATRQALEMMLPR